jgi:hypothetical protein
MNDMSARIVRYHHVTHKRDVVMDELKPGSHCSLRPGGSKVAFCYDPDRNRIELMGSAEVK